MLSKNDAENTKSEASATSDNTELFAYTLKAIT
jgi:hypothetical protein